MKKKNNSLQKPSAQLLKGVINEIDKVPERKLKISRPRTFSSLPFKMTSFVGMLIITVFVTRIGHSPNHDTSIVAIGLLFVAISGFIFPMVINYAKKKQGICNR